MKFKVGDRVKHKNRGLGNIVGIEINYNFPYILSLDDGDTIHTSKEYLSLVKPKKQTIVIKQNNNTVTAYMGKHKAVAECSPDDKFDLCKGAILALTRLLVEGKNNV